MKALRLIEETETGLLEEDAAGQIVYRDRHARSKDTKSTVSQATYSDAGGASLAYSAITQIDPLKFIFNELRAKLQFHSGAWILGSASLGVQTELASDPAVLWTLSETGSRSPSIAAGATATFTAQYPSSGSANTARAVDFWQDLTATTDYLANDSSDGTGTNRTANITVTETKRAQSMDIALANGHSGAVYITKLQARGNAVTAND